MGRQKCKVMMMSTEKWQEERDAEEQNTKIQKKEEEEYKIQKDDAAWCDD